jgi:hypothetical protein
MGVSLMNLLLLGNFFLAVNKVFAIVEFLIYGIILGHVFELMP